jgi:hypothetical protein
MLFIYFLIVKLSSLSGRPAYTESVIRVTGVEQLVE